MQNKYLFKLQASEHERAMKLAREKEEFAKTIMMDRLNELIEETKKAATKAKSKGGLTLEDADKLKGKSTHFQLMIFQYL